MGRLCKELLHQDAKVTPNWEEFESPIQNIEEWSRKRNHALHEMAKLVEGDKRSFSEKYTVSRAISLEGFQVLLEYDVVDRRERHKNGKLTGTDGGNGTTSFDVLKAFKK